MSVTRRRTLAEAHLALEAMISDVATLLEVVADDDMPDAYDDYTLQSMFTVQVAQRFAEQLVYRILHDDDFILEWRGSEDERRRRDREKYRGEPEEPDEDDTEPLADEPAATARLQREAHARAFRVGDEVRIKGRKPRGIISGRDATDPGRLQVRFPRTGATEWHDASELQIQYERPDEYPRDADPVPEDDGPAEMLTEIDLSDTDETPEAIAAKIVKETRKR